MVRFRLHHHCSSTNLKDGLKEMRTIIYSSISLLSSPFIGAVTAMHDAIALANLIYALPTKTSGDITKIFEEYQEERFPAVMESFENSKAMSKVTARGITGAILLFIMTHLPFWLWKLVVRSFFIFFCGSLTVVIELF